MGVPITPDLAAVAAAIRFYPGPGRARAAHVRPDGHPAWQPNITAIQPSRYGDGGPGRHRHRGCSSTGNAPRPVLPARVWRDLFAPVVEVLPRFADKREAVEITLRVERDLSAYLLTIT